MEIFNHFLSIYKILASLYCNPLITLSETCKYIIALPPLYHTQIRGLGSFFVAISQQKVLFVQLIIVLLYTYKKCGNQQCKGCFWFVCMRACVCLCVRVCVWTVLKNGPSKTKLILIYLSLSLDSGRQRQAFNVFQLLF